MKKKLIPLMTIILLIIPLVNAGLCKETILPMEKCNMTTPALSCSVYNYTIFNSTGENIKNGNLTNFNQDIYYFQFNQSQGEYVIRLCDGTSRRVSLTGGENNMYVALILIAISVPIIMLFISALLDKDVIQHNVLRLFCYTASFYWMQVISHLGVVMTQGMTVNNTMTTIYKGCTYLFYIYIIYLIYLYLSSIGWIVINLPKGMSKQK